MNDYSYHTVSSIINAFEKSVNFHFKYEEYEKIGIDKHKCVHKLKL